MYLLFMYIYILCGTYFVYSYRRGKARTQVSLVPRSIQRAPPAGQKPRPKTTESKSAESLSSDIIELADTSVVMEPQEKKTNADFRNMLLGKR